MLSDPRSARFAVWGTAFLTGRTSLDEATLRITACDAKHVVSGLPEDATPSGLTLALARLRTMGVTGLRVVLPVPGDPAGLGGPPAVTAAAVDAGEAVRTDGGPPLALVPTVREAGVRWQAYLTEPVLSAEPSLGEAERLLAETLAATTEQLLRLDCAGFGPEVAGQLGRMRADELAGAGTLPPGHPPRAARVLTLADRLTAIAELAAASDGGATSGTAAATRSALLRDLDRATRQARVAAYNAVLEPQR